MKNLINTIKVLFDVLKERRRQDKKWGAGSQNHLPNGTSKSLEDTAAWKKRNVDDLAKNNKLTMADILEEEFWEALAETDPVKLRTELVQVAAVAAKWIEKLDAVDLRK